MDDDRQTIDGDDLFTLRTAQIAKGRQGSGFAILDRPRRGGQIGAAVLERGKTGARAVSGDFDYHLAAVGPSREQALLVFPGTFFAVDIVQALSFEQPFDQLRAELGTNGVGALDAQYRLVALGGW